jgi:hypothetical protein
VPLGRFLSINIEILKMPLILAIIAQYPSGQSITYQQQKTIKPIVDFI